MAPKSNSDKIGTGIPGLDRILDGGLAPNRLYLVEGAPGTGKTTLALRFLLEGIERGEPGLYITLSETKEELVSVARSHGWKLDGIDIFELASADNALSAARELTVLHPWEVELGETIKLITDRVEAAKPLRVAFDSLSEMRLLAQDPLRYRRQILSLKQFFSGRNVTVLLLDDLTGSIGEKDLQLHSLCHGVITLERLTLDFGAMRRRMQVQKMRASPFRGGFHDMVIRKGGVEVFPRLVAAEHHSPFIGDPVPSGMEEMDALLDGGPLRGSCTLVSGPAGVGKTTLAMRYVISAAERGERCLVYEFDERIGTLLVRCAKLGLDLQTHIDSDRVLIRQVDAAEVSPGEFTWLIRREIEDNDARLVVIDSLNGFLAAMPQEAQLMLQLHELLSYLNQRGVATFLINPQQGLMGRAGSEISYISYISDAVLMLRFFEASGRIRKALSVIKNRGGGHEDAIRELRIDSTGVRIGEPLVEFQGILTGNPTYIGPQEPLLQDGSSADD